jgi:hypothetical protein
MNEPKSKEANMSTVDYVGKSGKKYLGVLKVVTLKTLIDLLKKDQIRLSKKQVSADQKSGLKHATVEKYSKIIGQVFTSKTIVVDMTGNAISGNHTCAASLLADSNGLTEDTLNLRGTVLQLTEQMPSQDNLAAMVAANKTVGNTRWKDQLLRHADLDVVRYLIDPIVSLFTKHNGEALTDPMMRLAFTTAAILNDENNAADLLGSENLNVNPKSVYETKSNPIMVDMEASSVRVNFLFKNREHRERILKKLDVKMAIFFKMIKKLEAEGFKRSGGVRQTFLAATLTGQVNEKNINKVLTRIGNKSVQLGKANSDFTSHPEKQGDVMIGLLLG